ncbi:Rieske (2Fe-2S) protein [Sphingomonas tabacisoli]|uniref:Rieske (2Fe-2S) protein n=1 Tax=Sphingomonas tabacisoli TaxID=2249466 RepID=A0ABW4I7P6_9SPHN
MADYRFAAHLSDLPEEGIASSVLDGQEILVCRSGGEVFAVENVCSHAGQPLAGGRVRNGWIMCPFHGARFDLETGQPLGPPAECPIRTYPVRIFGDAVEVDIGPD